MAAIARQRLQERVQSHMLWRYPELGTLVLGVLVVFLGSGTTWPVITIYMQSKGIAVGEIGLAIAAWMGANFLFQMPFGWLSDRIGRKPLLMFGLAMHAIVSLLFLFVGDMTGFLVLRFLEGVGGAAMMPSARAHIMDIIPPEKRGQAFGILGSAVNIGTLVGPAVGGFMVQWTGMTGPFWFGFFSSVIAGAFLLVKVHDRRKALPGTGADEAAEPVVDGPARLSWRAVAPVLVNAAGGGIVFGLFSVIWNIWLHDLGAPLDVIGLSYTIFALPLVFFGPWAGRLADRRNRVALILWPALVNTAIYTIYGFLDNVLLIIMLGLVEGFMLVLLFPAGDSYLADVVPARLRGRMQGMANSVNTAVGFGSAIACGVLYDINPLYVFLVLGAGTLLTAVVGAALMAPIERKLRPPGWKPRPEQPETAHGAAPAPNRAEDVVLAA